MFIIAELKDEKGDLIGVITLPPKDFKTGSKGFYANTKVDISGKRYQAQIQLVEIGSKPKTEGE
jgi:hypothetical protein